MRRPLLLVVLALASLSFLATPAFAKKSKPVSEDELLQEVTKDKAVEKKEAAAAPKQSMTLLLRDDLKDAFKNVMRAYFSEDEAKYLSFFSDSLTIASRARGKKAPGAAATKDDLKAKVRKEFAANQFKAKGLTVEDSFDFASPTMVFCLSEDQMHDKFPVWGFTIEPNEIAKFMKPGDYLVIANTRPQAADKVPSIAFTYYLIFRKVDDKFVAVGLD